MKHIFSFLIAICCFSFVFSNTYTVTTTADTGAGSLRQAITNANSSFSGGHTICFDIPFTDSGYDSASGTFTIHLQSELPYFLIVNNITIDGTSQAANKGNTNPLGPEVVLTCDSYAGTDYVGNDRLKAYNRETTLTIMNDYTETSGGTQLRVQTMEITYAQ